jgi:hypothetical protein
VEPEGAGVLARPEAAPTCGIRVGPEAAVAPEQVAEQEPVVEGGPASVAVEAPGRAQGALVAGAVSAVEERERALEAGGLEPAAVAAVEALGRAQGALVAGVVSVAEDGAAGVAEQGPALVVPEVAAVDLEVVVAGPEAAEEQEREAEALELAGELELPAGKARHRENG